MHFFREFTVPVVADGPRYYGSNREPKLRCWLHLDAADLLRRHPPMVSGRRAAFDRREIRREIYDAGRGGG